MENPTTLGKPKVFCDLSVIFSHPQWRKEVRVKTKKKTPTPAVRAVIIRVQWTPDDYAQLVRIAPRLADPREHEIEPLVELLRAAQKQLPPDRQMTSASVRQRVTQNMPKVIASINAAMASITATQATTDAAALLPTPPELPSAPQTVARDQMDRHSTIEVPEPADVEPVEPVEPVEAAANGKPPRVLVRWNAREHVLIAHEVSALLRKDRKTTSPELIDAVMRAQAKLLPRERWRPRSGVAQACYKTGRMKLMDRLRDAMKAQTGLHVPPAPPVPAVPTVAAPAAVSPAPAPAPASAPAPEPPRAAPAIAGTSEIEEALVTLVRSVVRQGLPILAQAVAQQAVALLRGDLLQDIDKAVRQGVHDVVGGPTEPAPQAQPAAPTLSVVPPKPMPQQPEKQRVDVIGLLGAQANVVRSAMGKAFDLRFVASDYAEHQRSVAPIVVLCTKFVNHSAQEKAKSRGAHVLFANGAAQSVIEQLQHLQTKRPHDLHASARA
jgi:hypothetical protein